MLVLGGQLGGQAHLGVALALDVDGRSDWVAPEFSCWKALVVTV